MKSESIGKETRVWQYSVILPNAEIDKNCNICAHVIIENDVVIGGNVMVKSGVQLWGDVHIDDNDFIGPNVTFYQ